MATFIQHTERKLALITGAGAGLGRAITLHLAQRDFEVIATDLRTDTLEQYADMPHVQTMTMDVTNSETIREVSDWISQRYGKLDALINNAGIFVGGPWSEIDEAQIEKVIQINVMGVIRVSRTCFELLRQCGGIVLNISSQAARFSGPFYGPYCLTKTAVESFSDSLRREWRPLGIRVSLIQAGAINTELLPKHVLPGYQDKHPLYAKRLEVIERIALAEHQKYAIPPERVAALVHRILNAPKPRTRYQINLDRRQKYILEIIPDSWADWLLEKFI
jgi:NAD(P)-dependent dehydrogenase (short-subunit alcohol dehydrogenase family)